MAKEIPHKLVIQPEQMDMYRKHVSDEFLLELDMSFKDTYEYCDNKGTTISTGAGPARNFIWEYSKANGEEWHWVMDDNIAGFAKHQDGKRLRLSNGPFDKMFEFASKFSNVVMAGPEYSFFNPDVYPGSVNKLKPAIGINRRIFSCNLIRNDIPQRWRGRWN